MFRSGGVGFFGRMFIRTGVFIRAGMFLFNRFLLCFFLFFGFPAGGQGGRTQEPAKDSGQGEESEGLFELHKDHLYRVRQKVYFCKKVPKGTKLNGSGHGTPFLIWHHCKACMQTGPLN